MGDDLDIEFIRGFVRLVCETTPPPDLLALETALDRLVAHVHNVPAGTGDHRDVGVPQQSSKLRERIGARFMALGFYGVAAPLDVGGDAMVGDAIDDLADIVGDLNEVVWRHENIGGPDACWHFHLLFRIHWGVHARGLAMCLHASIREGVE